MQIPDSFLVLMNILHSLQPTSRYTVLLPSLLLCLMALAQALVIWLGSRARSKAGIRIALAGVLTLLAFVCFVAHAVVRIPIRSAINSASAH